MQTSYHPGGNIQCTQTWADGLLDGLMWTYRVDGTLEQSQMFVKGLLHGPSILYHTDGSTVVRSLQFVHDLQVMRRRLLCLILRLYVHLVAKSFPGWNMPVVSQ